MQVYLNNTMIIKMKAQELRQLFLEFFRSKGHNIVPSAPMVVKNDPTLMFTNAGMNQFKDIFLGNQQPLNRRVANSQKCLRVSGKHNDLEEVGHDTYHHTMFEMLGNWSFGDYFKKEAIEWGWELLVKRLGIPEDRLYTTVFEGNKEDNVPRDNEAFAFWEKCFSNPEGRILEGSKKDNFWEMGETGPCGPCSEIHVDIRDDDERKKIPGNELVNKGHPHVIEIWNLVFIQYNRRSDGILEQLPSKHVDTGMGFERLCMVVQGKKSSYETDIFQSVIKEISAITGKAYGVNEKWDIALRVVADHLRAVSFSIADGQLPSNNKAGYVIRRILRRAVRYGYNNLGIEEPFMHQLVPVLARTMGNQYPELQSGKEQISKIIFEEETAFFKTLGKGLKMIERMITDLRKEHKNVLPGKVAFEMYDTFGFPVDLTQLILKENDIHLDFKGFEDEMKNQKERSREDASVKASGVRRIEAVTASKAEEYINERLNTVDEIASLLKSTGSITESVEKLIAENSSLKKTIEKFQAQSATVMLKTLVEKAVIINNIRFVSGQLETDSPDVLKNIACQIRNSSENTVLVIGSETAGKANILVMVSDNLVKERNINAVTIIKEIAGEINGGGGGQPFLATAGGKNPAGIQRALAKAADFLQKF